MHSNRSVRVDDIRRVIRKEGGIEQLAEHFLSLTKDGESSKDANSQRHAVLLLLLSLCQDSKSASLVLSVRKMEKTLSRLRKDDDASFPLRLCANDILGAARSTSKRRGSR